MHTRASKLEANSRQLNAQSASSSRNSALKEFTVICRASIAFSNRFSRTNARISSLVVAACMPGLLNVAVAQPQADQSAGVEEIMVTARKISERVQDVPASVVALSGEALQSAGITSLADIGRAVPGVTIVAAGPGHNELIIRGLRSSGGDSMVGYYIDDTPIAAQAAFGSGVSDPALFDLARVEVLRGPQGTLYGASSMGGTIKYITEQPNLDNLSGSSKLGTSFTEMGGLNTEVNSVIKLPIVDGIIAVRFGGFYRHNDGYIDPYNTGPRDILEVVPGAVDTNVNSEETYGGKVAVRIQATDWLTITPSASIQRMKLGGQFSFDYPKGSVDKPVQSRPIAEPSTGDQDMYSLNMRADFDKVSITSSTSCFSRTNDQVEDDSKETLFFYASDQSSVYPVPFFLHFPNHNLTEELRASFDFDRFTGVAGVFYQKVNSRSRYDWIVPPGYSATYGGLFAGETSFYGGGADVQDVQKAAFAELNYAVTPELKATIGGRSFKQDQRQSVFASGVLQGTPASNDIASNASGFTPKYSVAYALTEDALTYATASKGFRNGGAFVPIPFDVCATQLEAIGLTESPTKFEPDSLWNYELGAKTQWLDRRLTINADVYKVKWKDVQQSVSLRGCGFAFTGNFGSAKSEGAELEFQYEPIPALRLGAQVAFNQTQLTSTVIGTDGVEGQSLPFAPKWSGSASAEYRHAINNYATFLGRLDVNSSSQSFRSRRYDGAQLCSAGLQPDECAAECSLG